MKNKNAIQPTQEIKFQRADPVALALFDPSTKRCTMNCGPHAQDPRTSKERAFLCDDCVTVISPNVKSEEFKMGSYNIPPPAPAVIFDMDGTLADCEHRRHLVTGPKKNFDAFYDAMGEDKPVPAIHTLCNMYFFNDWHVIICTGRPEKYRAITEQWLKDYGIFYKELLMRPDERRHDPDFEVKQDMLDELRKNRAVLVAVDDRQQVVDMWRRNGVTCMQVADGNF